MATVAELGARVVRRLGVLAVPDAEQPSLTETVPAATLALRALQMLEVVGADETPASADSAAALAALEAVHDAQIALGHASWSNAAIPRACAQEYVALTAIQLAPVFGRQADPARVPQLEARIRQMAMAARAQALAEQKLAAVHAGFDATGRTRWGLADVPDHVEEIYVSLAAVLLAPEFGLQADPNAWALGERALNRAIAVPSSGERIRPEMF